MTLQVVFNQEKYQSILDVMPDVFSVWKVVLDNPVKKCFCSPYQEYYYKSGEQDASYHYFRVKNDPTIEPYPLFYHFWAQKYFVLDRLNEWLESYAELFRLYKNEITNENVLIHPRPHSIKLIRLYNNFKIGFPRVISCIVQKEWVTTIGKQDDGLAVVCGRAIFPEYPNRFVKPDMDIPIYKKSDFAISRDSDITKMSMSIVRAFSIQPMESYIPAMSLSGGKEVMCK